MARIVGIVTTRREEVGGGAPIFYAADREGLQKVAHLLEKILDCAAHTINEDLFIIVERE
ncbi:hypothetical protein B1A99_06780 [Cohnella sp. CIP 111063]|jgi:hypothetical protein|uniref:capping complex subunit for YIEGIA n=1 Tax=unclassified Cohnella TaxID=2636738 RepID=UPI000B8C62AF|nr:MULTISPECIES: hypothetical protein [unclassified Cohnella]OXS61213.1 hypothetical protein B1A99_06780 [Cohnella sp. CIP 111063]PRX73779.1 hypothetical protein B0G52_103379 [Cohnella sp. SGD-V74]